MKPLLGGSPTRLMPASPMANSALFVLVEHHAGLADLHLEGVGATRDLVVAAAAFLGDLVERRRVAAVESGGAGERARVPLRDRLHRAAPLGTRTI